MMDPLEHLRMVREHAAGTAPRRYDMRRLRPLRFTEPGFDRATWMDMCGRGLLGMLVPTERGGAGLGLRDFCKVAEALGAGLEPEPLIPAAMAAVLLPPEQLPAVLAGTRIVLPAWQEDAATLALTGITELREARLEGRKLAVPMAAGADAFLVTVPGGLALVERDAPGLHLELQQSADGGNLGTLTFDRAPATPIAGDASTALEQAIIATAAYLLGLTDRAAAITQAEVQEAGAHVQLAYDPDTLEQRLDDLKVQVALTRSVLTAAAATMDTEPALDKRQAAASRAKLRAADAATTVTRLCLQLHGGVVRGEAAELAWFQRKAVVLARQYGSAALHRVRLRRPGPAAADS